MDKYYLSKERLEELKKELETFKTTKRLEIAESLRQAKEYGDLSENSEYSEARNEQGRVETRIFELEEVLKHAVIIKKVGGNSVVAIGSTVTAMKDGKTYKYEIVGSEEAKPEAGKISNESPLGRSFLQHKVGDSVSFSTPNGHMSYQITKIE